MSLHSLVGPPAAALVTTTALAYGGFRSLGALVGDGDAALARVRKLVRVGLPVVFGGAFVVLSIAGLPELVDVALRAVSPSLVDTRVDWVASQLLTGTACVLVVIAGYLGLWPAITRVRDTRMAPSTAAWLIFRYAMVPVVAFVVLLPTAMLAVNGGAWLGAAAVVVGTVALLAAQPHVVRLQHPTREPTADERERLASLADAVDARYTGVTVSELADAKTAWLDFLGAPGRRWLHVTDYLLDEMDDGELRTLLATNAERTGRYWLEWRLFATLVGVASVVAGLIGWPGLSGAAALVVALGGVAALLGGGWWGRRIVFRADAAAAERVGADVVADALRRYADLNDADYEWNRLAGIVRMQPSLPRRLERLRAETGASASAVEDERPA